MDGVCVCLYFSIKSTTSCYCRTYKFMMKANVNLFVLIIVTFAMDLNAFNVIQGII